MAPFIGRANMFTQIPILKCQIDNASLDIVFSITPADEPNANKGTIFIKAASDKKEKMEEEKKATGTDDEIMKLKLIIEDMKKGY